MTRTWACQLGKCLVGMMARHTELFLSSLSHGKTLESTTGVGTGTATEVDVAHDLPLQFLLSAMALPTISPADRRAVANFILTDSERRGDGRDWRM